MLNDGTETIDAKVEQTVQIDAPSDVLRRCIVTGETLSKSALVRFVVSPADDVTPDILNKLPGRGLWVRADADTVTQAVKRKVFAKAAKQSVSVSDGLTETVERLLTKRCLDGLSRANRAGQAVAGFEKALSALKSGRASVYSAACDASNDGVDRLSGAARGQGAAIARVLTRDEMGGAFGRGETAHVSLLRGGLATSFLNDCARLSGFRLAASVTVPGGSKSDPAGVAREGIDG